MSEHWPPEWEDPDTENLDDDELDGADLDGENLADVTAALASMPLPALPEAFQARISAAIRAEAVTRTEPAGATGVSATVRSSSPDGFSPAAADSGTTTGPPAHLWLAGVRRGARRPGTSRASGPADSRPRHRERGERRGFRAFQAIGSLVIFLVLAGFGYLVFGHGDSSESSSFSIAAPAAAGSASGFQSAAASARSASRPASGHEQSGLSQNSRFVVRETGTRYEPATLAGQARAVVAATGGSSAPESASAASASASSAAASGSLSTGGYAPPAALADCVGHLTGNQAPSLVDRATYAGRAAYIIVVPRQAWVVGLGCTAANPELITSVALAGLSGNLRALGSV